MCEVWRAIPKYEVSNLGRIKSVTRSYRSGNHGGMRVLKESIKKTPKRQGYPTARLSKEGTHTTISVHRLVLLVFVGPCPEDYEVGHLDGTRDNNKLENLRYMTRRCNQAFKLDHGTENNGENNWNAKLTEAQVQNIKASLENNTSVAELAKVFNVCKQTIRDIKNNRTWAHLSDKPSTRRN